MSEEKLYRLDQFTVTVDNLNYDEDDEDGDVDDVIILALDNPEQYVTRAKCQREAECIFMMTIDISTFVPDEDIEGNEIFFECDGSGGVTVVVEEIDSSTNIDGLKLITKADDFDARPLDEWNQFITDQIEHYGPCDGYFRDVDGVRTFIPH